MRSNEPTKPKASRQEAPQGGNQARQQPQGHITQEQGCSAWLELLTQRYYASTEGHKGASRCVDRAILRPGWAGRHQARDGRAGHVEEEPCRDVRHRVGDSAAENASRCTEDASSSAGGP